MVVAENYLLIDNSIINSFIIVAVRQFMYVTVVQGEIKYNGC